MAVFCTHFFDSVVSVLPAFGGVQFCYPRVYVSCLLLEIFQSQPRFCRTFGRSFAGDRSTDVYN